jgi:hypothetical protein
MTNLVEVFQKSSLIDNLQIHILVGQSVGALYHYNTAHIQINSTSISVDRCGRTSNLPTELHFSGLFILQRVIIFTPDLGSRSFFFLYTLKEIKILSHDFFIYRQT